MWYLCAFYGMLSSLTTRLYLFRVNRQLKSRFYTFTMYSHDQKETQHITVSTIRVISFTNRKYK